MILMIRWWLKGSPPARRIARNAASTYNLVQRLAGMNMAGTQDEKPVASFRNVGCNLCGSDDVEQLGKPRVSERVRNELPIPRDVSVVRCKNCGFYYTAPMPFWSMNDLQSLYGGEYFPPMSRWWTRVKTGSNPQRRLELLAQQAPCRIASFLEVGCGLGYGLEEALKRGWSVYGQEASQTFADRVKERLGIDVFVGQLAEAPYHPHYFDAIYVDSVLEHLPQSKKMLEEIHRLLKPDGVAYIVVTNEEALMYRCRSILSRFMRSGQCPRLNPFSYPYHIVGFTRDTFARACSDTNLEIKHLTICAGAGEWRKYAAQSIRSLLRNLACYPIYLLGEVMGKGIAIEAVIAPRR